MANPKTPPGGFQQGGWYDGKQYWNGTFSEPGQINPQSNQPGAGQLVSKEVIAQTAPQNVAYIEQQRQQAKLAPSPAKGVPTAPAQTAQTSATAGTAGATAGTAGAIAPQPTIDLQSIYNNQLNSPEMKARQDKVTQTQTILSQREKEKIEAVGAINDNPFLSEATRVGRVAKLESLYNDRTANLRKDIEMAAGDLAKGTADAEMQLNLQIKQFDINSQAARTSFDQVTSLIASGAYDGASGEDIASATRATGLSSSMIQSAIDARKQKNLQTSVVQYDDGTNQGFAVINQNTGEIINQQKITSSKPKAATEGDKNTQLQSQFVSALESKKNSYGHISPQDWQGAVASWISRGGTRKEFNDLFANYADPNRDDFTQAYGFESL